MAILRTIIVLVAAFLVGSVTPPDAVLIPLATNVVVGITLMDFILVVSTGKGITVKK